jgi:hypothetical protein
MSFLGEGNDSIAGNTDIPTVPLRTTTPLILGMVATQLLARASFTMRVLLILVMVMTLSLLTEALMALLVTHMAFITTAVQLLLVTVTTPSLLMEALSQPRTAVEPGF